MALAQRQALARGQTRPAAVSRRAVVVRAQYPDPSFIAATRREFPSKGVATPDEARVSPIGAMFHTAIGACLGEGNSGHLGGPQSVQCAPWDSSHRLHWGQLPSPNVPAAKR